MMTTCPMCGNDSEVKTNYIVRCKFCGTKFKTPRKLQRGYSAPEEVDIKTTCGPCNKEGNPPLAYSHGKYQY